MAVHLLAPWHRPLRVIAVLAACAGLIYCNAQIGGGEPGDGGPGGPGGPDMGVGTGGPRHLVGLQVTPNNGVLMVDLNATAQQPYKVAALYSDNTTIDVTGKATLTSDNPATGTLQGATFTAAMMAMNKVDFTHIKATYQDSGKTLTGLANLTVVWLRQSGPSQDFFFTLPYGDPDQKKPLSFTTLIQSLDAFFAVDTTGSMAPEINQLTNSLANTIIPGVKAAAAKDAWFGVGAQEDFGYIPYGQPNYRPGLPDDQPLILLSAMNADVATAQAAVAKLLVGGQTRGNGYDLPEGHMETLYQIATGAGNVVSGVVNIPANHSGIGGVGFRNGALPVVTLMSDAIFHTKNEAHSCNYRDSSGNPGVIDAQYSAAPVVNAAHTRQEVKDALNQICAKFIGVSALRTSIMGALDDPNGICNATADMVDFANATGAVVPPVAWDVGGRPAGCNAGQCCTGLNGAGESPDASGNCPLVFKIPMDGSGVGGQIVSGITQLARFATFDVVTSTSGTTTSQMNDMLPAPHTSADFIKSILPLDSMPPPPPPAIPAPVISGDHFTKVTPGSVVRFTIDAKNDFLKSTDHPEVFHATIKIRAGGCADLDQRDVIILVPPSAPPAIG